MHWWLMISCDFTKKIKKNIFSRFLGRFGWSNLAYILSHFPFRCCDSHRIKKIGVFSIWRWTWLFTNASRSSKRIQLVFKQSFANFVGVYIYEKYARRIVSVEFFIISYILTFSLNNHILYSVYSVFFVKREIVWLV